MTTEPDQEIAIEPIRTGSNSFVPMKVGINEAARLTGASKNTVAKYADDGTLSWELNAQGKRVFQVAELQRVFPNMKAQNGSQGKSVSLRDLPKNGSDQGNQAVKIAVLEGEKRTLEALLNAEKEKGRLLEEIAQKAERNADDLRQAMKMLTYQPTSEEQEKKPTAPVLKKKWRLFGGGDR
jgi:DNA-binding transcriptional MerR regulator